MKVDETYFELVAKFPIVPIESWEHHTEAINVLLSFHERDGELTESEIAYGKALGTMVEDFESKELAGQIEKTTGNGMLEFIMDQHNMSKNQIAELLGMSLKDVIAFLKGKKSLSLAAREILAARFGLRAELFELNS